MHGEFPAHQRLAVHLENEQQVYFDSTASPETVLSREAPETTLTAWMKYNRSAQANADHEAQNILYPDFCEKYTYHKELKPRVWLPRKAGFGGIVGRIYSVSPQDIEKYHLRLLLYKIPGATCFRDLRTFEGQVFPTYQATARAMGLLTDNSEWSATLAEAASHQPPRALRRLFCMILAHCECSDPFDLWNQHKEKFAEDYLYKAQQIARELDHDLPTEISDEMYDHCLLDINDILLDLSTRLDLKFMEGFESIFPQQDTRGGSDENDNIPALERVHIDLIAAAQSMPDPISLLFNADQRIVYDTIRSSIDAGITDPTLPRLFFVDGPGGTGKTFLFNALLDSVRRDGNVAIAVASSGTASLLLKGGRTSHSMFNIPLNVSPTSYCGITPRSVRASLLKKAKLIIWDESSMTSKDIIEAVDRTMRDIFKQEDPLLEHTPFGGRLFVFAGDFRQVLPVIPKASRSEVVNSCMNRSFLWSKFKVLKLRTNMRVQQALQNNNPQLATELQQFAHYLLDIGEGKVRNLILPPYNQPTDYIPVSNRMHVPGNNFLNLIKAVYPNVPDPSVPSDYFIGRAIMTPKNADVSIINKAMLASTPGQ